MKRMNYTIAVGQSQYMVEEILEIAEKKRRKNNFSLSMDERYDTI